MSRGGQCANTTAVALCFSVDFTGMDLGVADAAGEQDVMGQQTVLVVEKKCPELFTLQPGHAQA